MLETSVFDPWWERTLKGGARTLIPSTPRETANELFLSALPLGPVLSKLASKVGPPTRRAVQRFVNPPFEKSRRKALLDIGGQETLENVQRRNIFPKILSTATRRRRLRNKELHKAIREWSRAKETKSTKPGILGDLIEHGNILARKIREETAKEAGASVEKASRASAKARWGVDSGDEDLGKLIDNILRRLGVGEKP